MSNFITDPFTSSSIVYLSLNELLLIVPVRINLSNTHCGSCQLLQSDIIHPPSHIFPLVTPSGLASVNHASQTPHAFCCSHSCDTVHSSLPLQCEGFLLGHNCPPTTLSLNLVLPFVYQILTSFRVLSDVPELCLLSQSQERCWDVTWARSIPPPLFCATGKQSSLDVLLEELQLNDWQKTKAGCPWHRRRSQCVFVAHAEDRPRGQHSRAHPRLCGHRTNRISHQRLNPQEHHSQLPQPFVSLTKAMLHIPCLWGTETSTSFFASVLQSFWLGQIKLSKVSRISTQQSLERDLHFTGIPSLQN